MRAEERQTLEEEVQVPKDLTLAETVNGLLSCFQVPDDMVISVIVGVVISEDAPSAEAQLQEISRRIDSDNLDDPSAFLTLCDWNKKRREGGSE